MSAHDLLIMMGAVLVASIGTQLLAAWLKLPAILPLLAVGVLLGPELLGLVESDALGVGLRVLIPLMVAVIVFEGGMVLDLNYLRQVGPVVRNLITVGCAVTALLAALAANLFAGMPWGLALLFGSLVSVTGPTVINPLLRRAAVTQRLKTILMAEGVLVDAVGVVLAVVVLEGLMVGLTPLEGAGTWAIRVGGGTVLGIAGGWLLGRGLQLVGRSFGAELTRLSALGGALAIYTVGEVIAPEVGIAAAAAAGVVVGNMSFPHEEQVHHFKGDLTQIGIGVIFVLLAARLRFSDLLALGWGGLAVVLALMLVVRPASVFLSTVGARLSTREKLFIASVGPRGIVAASFATFAALRLEDAGYAGSEALSGLVFLVIIGTVVVQSFTTPWAARMLGVQPMLTVIVGADPLGRALGRHLTEQGEESVMVLDNLLRRPSTLKLLSDLDSGKEVREVQLRNRELAGRALKDIRLEGDVLVAMVRRGGSLFVPHGATTLSADDLLTLIGASDDVVAATALFEGGQPARPAPAAALLQKPRR